MQDVARDGFESAKIKPRGWAVVMLAMLGVASSVIPVAGIAFSTFVVPLEQIFDWGRADITLTVSILMMSLAISMPLGGFILDKVGIWLPAAASLVLYGAFMLLVPKFANTYGLAGLYFSSALLGLLGATSTTVTYSKLISRNFTKNRGLALGFVTSGIGLGGAIAPMVANTVMSTQGWAYGYQALAVFPLLIGLPVLVILRQVIGSEDEMVPAEVAGSKGVAFNVAVQTKTFWLLFTILLIAAISIHGVQIHMVALLRDAGFQGTTAVGMASAVFIVSIFARIGAGFLFDRVFAPHITAVAFVGAAFAFMFLSLSSSNTLLALVTVALLGIAAGAESDFLAYVVSRYFGMTSFARILGVLFSAFMIGSAAGPYLMGVGYDLSGDYQVILFILTAAMASCVCLLCLLPKFPNDKQKCD